MNTLSEEIESIRAAGRFDFYGIADLGKYSEPLAAYGYPLAGDFSRAISIGVVLSHPIVDKISVDPPFPAIGLYRHFCYDVVNQKIDSMLLRIAGVVSAQGYDALPIPASGVTDPSRLFGSFSHKAAAHLSGLGWLGKNCLLINESAGPRARWGTVLTNAPLSPTGKPAGNKCGTCDVCVTSCPAGAFTGVEFNMEEKREVRYDAFKCDRYLSEREISTGYRVCGVCLAVCPFGKR